MGEKQTTHQQADRVTLLEISTVKEIREGNKREELHLYQEGLIEAPEFEQRPKW